MHDKVTEKDVELMKAEIEHRKLVVRKEALEDVKTARANSLRGWISGDSPLGSAVLGHRVGDRVHVAVGDTAGYDVTILSLENTGDDDSIELRKF